MADHEKQHIIRIPEKLWNALLLHRYIADNTSDRIFRIFAAAYQGRSGGGHSRYIKGDRRSLTRILELLKQLIERIREGEYCCRDIGTTLVDLDRFAHQQLKDPGTVKIRIDSDGDRPVRYITGADLPEIS